MFSFAVWALYCRLFWGPGWITPAIPVALLFLGLTKLSSRIVRNVPASLKAGIIIPAFSEMWNYLPFTVGFPSAEMLLATISTASIAYIIAFGDVIVGEMLVRSAAKEVRSDEKVDIDANRVHIVTGLRNVLHSFLVPYPG
ncbi:MAG: hypothetical protein WAU91_05805, partial [Desulfatitalea sp.]